MNKIPEEILRRNPLMKPEWMATLLRMREHPDAPRWNIQIGDRIMADDFEFITRYEKGLRTGRAAITAAPSRSILDWISGMASRSEYFRRVIGSIDIPRDFDSIRPMTRQDLQGRLDEIVPADEPLDRIIVNPTSGTTGQPILAPNHPRAIGCYDPLIAFCLERHGVRTDFDHTKIAAIQVCYQKETIVYNTVHSYLKGAGFAKINLDARQWPRKESAARYIRDMAPVFYSGDPVTFIEMMECGIDYRPAAILTSALTMEPGLREKLESNYACPVVDFYSLNETGPIGYSCPEDPSCLQVLPNDIYMEIVDDTGKQCPDGVEGRICVTGGRNPFIPLLRYDTGDRGVILDRNGSPGDPAPKFRLAGGRRAIMFESMSGGRVNPIDISRVLRNYPVRRHQCIQHRDLSLTLRLDGALAGHFAGDIKQKIQNLFDKKTRIEVIPGWEFKDEAFIPYVKE